MRSYRKLAWKEISEQKTVSVLILTAVILSTMMTAAVGQSVGVLTAMRSQQAITIGGNRYASFVQLSEKQAQYMENDKRLSYAQRYISIGSMELNDLLSLDLAEYWGEGVEAVQPAYARLAEGSLPKNPMEIALSEDALQFLGFNGKVGDTISLSLKQALRHGVNIEEYSYTADFVLTGIIKSNYTGYTFGKILGIVGEGSAEEVLPPDYLYYNMDIRTADKGDFQSVVDDLCETLGIHELDTLYNYPYLNALGIKYRADDDPNIDDSGFSFLTIVGTLVVVLVLAAAGLVIYNVLKISVMRRIGQYGVLRAIGAQKGQLYRIVAQEILLLCAVGIPAGMFLGLLSAKGILSAALNQLSPEMFLVQDSMQLHTLIAENSSGKWGFLLLSAVITLLFAFLTSAPAAWYAAKVSPVTAMQEKSGTKIRRRNHKIKKIRGFERYYAALNMRRNKSRTVITILSLVMSITVFITLQGSISQLSVAGEVSQHLGDYSVVNEYSGFSPEDLQKMEAEENVEEVAAQQLSVYELDEQYYLEGVKTDFTLGIGEAFQIFGFNEGFADYSFKEKLSKEQLEAFKAGEGCVVRNPLPLEVEGMQIGTTHIEEGSVITIEGRKLPVLLSISGYDSYFSIGNNGFLNGVQVIVSDSLYPALTGTDVYAELRPTLRKDADRDAFELVLDELCTRVGGTTWISYEQTDRQIEESSAQINMLAWGLILFIGVIGILNIINTVYTNIHTRVTEIGTQRAIGMSVGSLYKTFLWEGIYYGMTAALIGSVAGYVCSMFAEAATSDIFALIPVPVTSILEAMIVSVAACLAATAIPLRRISRLSIVEAVGAVE